MKGMDHMRHTRRYFLLLFMPARCQLNLLTTIHQDGFICSRRCKSRDGFADVAVDPRDCHTIYHLASGTFLIKILSSLVFPGYCF